MSYFSVVSNLTIVVFTDRSELFGNNWSIYERLIFFVIVEHVLFGLKYFVSAYIPDVPYATALQLDRQKYLVDKHIFGVRDIVVADTPMDHVATPAAPGGGIGSQNPMTAVAVGVKSGGRPARTTAVERFEVAPSWHDLVGVPAPVSRGAGATAPGMGAASGSGVAVAPGITLAHVVAPPSAGDAGIALGPMHAHTGSGV
jgi:hypothetical protein